MNAQDLKYPLIKKISLLKLAENILMLIALMCFSLSLFLPIFFTSAEDINGFWVLITGWMGLIILQLAWFANPLNLLALLMANKRPRVAFLLSLLAFALASNSFIFFEIPTGINYEKVYIQEFGIGFYFWITSHILVLFGLFFGFINSLKKN